MAETVPLRILVVEDSPAIRAHYEAELAGMDGVRICGWAETAADAIHQIRTLAPDLVILDLSLTGSSGIEVLTALRQLEVKPVTMVVSSEADPTVGERCRKLGARGYYDKADGFVQLMEDIESLCASSRGSHWLNEIGIG